MNFCQLFLKGNTHENNKLEILRRNWKGRSMYIERLGEMDPSDSHLAEAKELLWEVKCVGHSVGYDPLAELDVSISIQKKEAILGRELQPCMISL